MQESDADGLNISRRGVLGVLAAGAGAVGFSEALDADGSTPGGGDLALGDDAATRTRGSWDYGEIYTAPETVPADSARENYVWSYDDQLGVKEIVTQDSLPTSWTANGIEWCAGTSLSAAEAERTTEPAILFGMLGNGSATAELVAPDDDRRWQSNGIEIVIAGNLDDARSLHSGAEPAVLFGTNGTGEVVVA